MGRGDCCALYFMVEDREYEWYNQNVKGMDKSKFAAQKALEETRLLFDSLMQNILDGKEHIYGNHDGIPWWIYAG